MKRLLLLASFVMLGLGLNAQCTKTASEGKACCASKKGTKVASASATSQAEIAAAENENIQKRVCEQTGKVSFYEKSVCSNSGSVSWNEVVYNETDKKFTRVASAGMERDVKTGEVKTTTTKACCKKDGAGAKACAAEKKKEGSL